MKNLKLFIKTIIIFFTICILIVLSFILIKLANRYIVVNKFSNNLASKYLEKNDIYNFSKDVFYWSPTENKFYSEITYCKDNVLKKEYYKAFSFSKPFIIFIKEKEKEEPYIAFKVYDESFLVLNQ